MATTVMTGATSGIGRVAAEEMLERDPDLHLVLLAREATGRATVAELSTFAPRVSLVEMDLANLASVQSAVAEVRRRVEVGEVPPLTGIVGNAGVSLGSAQQVSADGYEMTFAVNVLAHHALVAGLAPLLGPGGRVVLTVSDTHFGDVRHGLGMPSPRWTTPEEIATPGTDEASAAGGAGRVAYTTSKLGGIYLVHEWARRLPEATVLAYNPGLVPGTGLARDLGRAAQVAMSAVAGLLARTPIASTVPVAGHRLADAVQGRVDAASGSYIDRARADRSSEESYDPAREAELWEFAESVRMR